MTYILCPFFSPYVVSSRPETKIAVSTVSWHACSVNSSPSATLSWDKLRVASAPRKPAAAAVGTKWEMTVTVLVIWIVASWMLVVNHQTVWKSVWNAVEFVFLHKYLSFLCVKTGEPFKLFLLGGREACGKILMQQPSICTVDSLF